MTIVHPIARAWLSAGDPAVRTASQNYDEFADDAEITSIIAARPYSALAVEMPHLAPDSAGVPFSDALPAAARRLARAKAAGGYTASADVAVLYRITPPAGEPAAGTAYGVFCMVETDQISTSADEPGLVIRNEDVFLDKVRERVALAEATGHLVSPVLLLQTGRDDALHEALGAACAAAGSPAAVDIDRAGRNHEIWPLPAGAARDELLALAGGGDLVVADGNHRSLAAQVGHLPRFLAVVTTPASVTIQPYNRLVTELPLDPAAFAARLAAAGARLGPATGDEPPPRGVVRLYSAEGWREAVLPPAPGGAGSAGAAGLASSLLAPGGGLVDNLDHALVERVLLGEVLGLDAGDKRITYVGGDYPPAWLTGEVDAGRADLAVLIPPVTVDDFVAVNLARRKLPRKSTWFTPKARAGLVLAELG